MAERISGEYRDAHLEIERLLRQSGPIAESAVQMAIQIHAPFFTQVGPDLRHRLTGETIEDWTTGRRKSAPHDYLDYMPDDEAQIEFAIIEDACLRPSPKNVGALFKKVGEKRAREIMKQWNADPVKMIAGQRPSYAAAEAEKIDLAAERRAFGLEATPAGRASLYKKYGDTLAEQRRIAWGADVGTIRSGREPDSNSVVIKSGDRSETTGDASNSPFNPNKRFLTEETRANECAKFAVRFGTAAVRSQCQKFGVDIAGRVLAKRA